MNRDDAYALLSRELLSWQHRPYEQLVSQVDQPASERNVRLGEEDVTLRVAVRWASEKKTAVRIEAVADGPSWYRLERLEESIVVGLVQFQATCCTRG
jgi:hypothetical protein